MGVGEKSRLRSVCGALSQKEEGKVSAFQFQKSLVLKEPTAAQIVRRTKSSRGRVGAWRVVIMGGGFGRMKRKDGTFPRRDNDFDQTAYESLDRILHPSYNPSRNEASRPGPREGEIVPSSTWKEVDHESESREGALQKESQRELEKRRMDDEALFEQLFGRKERDPAASQVLKRPPRRERVQSETLHPRLTPDIPRTKQQVPEIKRPPSRTTAEAEYDQFEALLNKESEELETGLQASAISETHSGPSVDDMDIPQLMEKPAFSRSDSSLGLRSTIKQGDVIHLTSFDKLLGLDERNPFLDVKDRCYIVATIAPHGNITNEWLRLLSGLGSRLNVQRPNTLVVAICGDLAPAFGRLRKRKLGHVVPLRDASITREFLRKFGQRISYIFRVDPHVEGGPILTTLRVYSDVSEDGHVDELQTFLKAHWDGSLQSEPADSRRVGPDPVFGPLTQPLLQKPLREPFFEEGSNGTVVPSDPQEKEECDTLDRPPDRQTSPGSTRLVINHSTHIPGLLDVLQRLAAIDTSRSGIQTIVPGRLSRSSSRSPRLSIRVTTRTQSGYKLLARKSGAVQEVFLVLHASMASDPDTPDHLETLLHQALQPVPP